jgi:hypothetical protein
MDLTEGSETSANINQTPGIHPKFDTVNTEHSKSLKSRIMICIVIVLVKNYAPVINVVIPTVIAFAVFLQYTPAPSHPLRQTLMLS